MAQAWLVRPYPHDIPRITEFRQGGFVAIGWPGIGDLSGCSREELKQILEGSPYHLSGLALGAAYATVDIFVNRIAVGDLLLIPDGADIYFAEVTGAYYMDPAYDGPKEGYSHRRKVRFLASVARDQLSMPLRSSLKVHRTAADLSRHFPEIDALAHARPYEGDAVSDVVHVCYPLRRDFSVQFDIPADITCEEASRLARHLETLYFVK